MANLSLTNLPIPDDVIVNNVLLNLPVKSLMRFKCVSRAWLDSITGFDFVESYNFRSRVSHRMLFHDADELSNLIVRDTKGDSSTIGLENGHRCLFSNVCDGLVCVYKEWGNEVVVLNLTTRETRRVSCCLGGGRVNLGFDPIAKRYKVVCLYERYCKVLALGPENIDYNWREVCYPDLALHFLETVLTYIGGRFYSISTRRREITYFDLVSEEFGSIKVPEVLRGEISEFKTPIITYAGKPTIVIKHANRIDLWMYDLEGVFGSKKTVELLASDFVVLGSLQDNGILSRNLLIRFANFKLYNLDIVTGLAKWVSIYQPGEYFLGIVDINIAPLAALFR